MRLHVWLICAHIARVRDSDGQHAAGYSTEGRGLWCAVQAVVLCPFYMLLGHVQTTVTAAGVAGVGLGVRVCFGHHLRPPRLLW